MGIGTSRYSYWPGLTLSPQTVFTYCPPLTNPSLLTPTSLPPAGRCRSPAQPPWPRWNQTRRAPWPSSRLRGLSQRTISLKLHSSVNIDQIGLLERLGPLLSVILREDLSGWNTWLISFQIPATFSTDRAGEPNISSVQTCESLPDPNPQGAWYIFSLWLY